MVWISIWVGLFSHLFVAIYFSLFMPTHLGGVHNDAAGFYRVAVQYSRGNIMPSHHLDVMAYSRVLGKIFYWTTDSVLVGNLMSVFAWLLSAFVLIGIMRMLSADKSLMFKAMLIYGLLPTATFFTSITLREAYELLLVNLMVYSALKIYLKKKYFYWPLLIIFVIFASRLHAAILAFGGFVIIGTLVMPFLHSRKSISVLKLAIVVPLAMQLMVFIMSSTFFNINNIYDMSGGLAEVLNYRLTAKIDAGGNTRYLDRAEFGGVVGSLSALSVGLFRYLFEPMPWRIVSVFDMLVFFENLLRAWLIWNIFSGISTIPVQLKKPMLFTFLLYLVIETIWSLGTTTWGTASRHHIPGMGLLLVAASVRRRKSLSMKAS